MRRGFTSAAALLCVIVGCGGAAEESTGPSTTPEDDTLAFADDPERSRPFQDALVRWARPIDSGLTTLFEGGDVDEAFGDVVIADGDWSGVGAQARSAGARRLMVGALSLRLRVVGDRGPPQSDRYNLLTFESSAQRLGGIWRYTAIGGEFHRQSTEPDIVPTPAGPAADLAVALSTTLTGPPCRYIPLLTSDSARGILSDSEIAALDVDQEILSRDTMCEIFWDARRDVHEVTISDLRIHALDDSARVVGTFTTSVAAGEGGTHLLSSPTWEPAP